MIEIKKVKTLGGILLQHAKDKGFSDDDLVIVSVKIDEGKPLYSIEKIIGSPTEFLAKKFFAYRGEQKDKGEWIDANGKNL